MRGAGRSGHAAAPRSACKSAFAVETSAANARSPLLAERQGPRQESRFAHPARRRPSGELKALDKLYDRKARNAPLSRPSHTAVLARRARQGTGYYGADDYSANPQQIKRWGAVAVPQGRVSHATATSAAVHVCVCSVRNAPRVRRLGGGSVPTYDAPRPVLHEADADVGELAVLQSGWRQPSGMLHRAGAAPFSHHGARNAPFSFHGMH